MRERAIGLYGGTFDPIHNGHLILARDAMEKFGWEKVVFIPAAVSPHKAATPPASPEARWNMLLAAIDGEPGFEADDCELRREGPSYSVDTATLHAERQPGARLDWLLGDDQLAALDTWKDIARLRTLVRFVRLGRGPEVAGENDFPSAARRIGISSTEIRDRIARGLSVRYFIPDKVHDVITELQLYRTPND